MNSIIEWASPPAAQQLTKTEIHVYRASLDCDLTAFRYLESTLTDDEKMRANRFVLERDRDHFIAARGFLRDLLGAYLRCAPKSIKFEYGPRGKPRIATNALSPPITFNLSHSHQMALAAIGCEREIGIDIELIRPEFAGEEIAKRFFSSKEVEELSQLPPELRPEAFFLCWTRKEAYIKARGDGLHVALDSFSVSLSGDLPPTLSSEDESRWRMESFVPSLITKPKYLASLAAEGQDWEARYFQWEPELANHPAKESR